MKIRFSLLSAIWLLSAVPAGAQSSDAVLSGTVTDASGANVPAARVTAENVNTGIAVKTLSNDSGVYVFAALQPGVYRLSAEHDGFHKLVYEGLELEVGARLNLNLRLEIGAVSDSVEVTATNETLLGIMTSSVGLVLSDRAITDLVFSNRNALSRFIVTAGALPTNNFSGSRRSAPNVTLDGISVRDNFFNNGVSSMVFPSVDQVEEVRIVTSPADAEFGRGSGQVHMLSRSGSNEFHGSLFEMHQNTVLNANTWFNNQRGSDPRTGRPLSPRNDLVSNEFGGRMGGRLLRNRSFFHVDVEQGLSRRTDTITSLAYTDSARKGVFRFFPGLRNGNADAAVPTVDLAGNPVRPSSAAELQSVNLFGRDPNRSAQDRSGAIQRMLDLMPLPNNFRFGDGLNTAGYTWNRDVSAHFLNHFNLRLDHILNSAHRLSFAWTAESTDTTNGFAAQPFPGAPGGKFSSTTSLFSLALISTLRPSLLNEFRAGALRPFARSYSAAEIGGTALQPRAASQPYFLLFGQVTNPLNASDPNGSISPFYHFADNVTWIKGRHTFKAGGEVRFPSSNRFDAGLVTPRAALGAGGVPAQNIGSIAGIGPNQGAAEQLLAELAGSVARVTQAFNSPGGPQPQFLPGEPLQRTMRQREFSLFFKNDFKVSPRLTLNLGVRYEWYGVPYIVNGKDVAVIGGLAGLFGISGSGFADLHQPGRMAGSLTRLQAIGPGSANPGLRHYRNDNNNLAPAVGLTWALPWPGRDKTVLRLGYGISYEHEALGLLAAISQPQPGLRQVETLTPASYLDLSRLSLPLAPSAAPFAPVPVNDYTQYIQAFDPGLRTPYIQNWNVSLQRQLTRTAVLDVRYVGSKGTRLICGIDVNEETILENGILDAFRMTQAGGNSPLLDRIYGGLNIPGLGVVDGSRITGSDAVRFNSTTQAQLASNGVAGLASYLATTPQFTGQRGGLLRRAGLPDNFVYVNPQFSESDLTSNLASSTYHALQVEGANRLSSGWMLISNYTWSRALGQDEGDRQDLFHNFRDVRNWRLDKRLMDFHRTHNFRNSLVAELPFGPGKKFLRASRGLAARLAERWQLGMLLNLISGQPIELFAFVDSWNTFGNSTPTAAADFARNTGSVQRTWQGVVYFAGLRQVPDPAIANLTTQQNVRGRSNLRAIADGSGHILLVNPAPGTIGNLSQRILEGPGLFRFNVNLIKRVALAERKTLEFRADVLGILNRPIFSNPIADINAPNFGRITFAEGNRLVTLTARLNF